jgi:hypothetical protein
LGVLDAVLLGVVEVVAAGVEEDDDEDGELLQAAAASPMQTMPNAAADRLLDVLKPDVLKLGIPRR